MFLFWLLFFSCYSDASATMPGHLLAAGEESYNRGSPKNYSRIGNNRTMEKNFHRPEPSTVNCARPWSCCDPKSGLLPHETVKCGESKTLSVVNSFCATIDEENDVLDAGHCLYNYNDSLYTDFPQNISMQGNYICSDFHRTGILCGKCQDGYYPLAYSYDMTCVQCPNGKSNWWKFVLAAFLPLTIFYMIILFLKINVISSHFQGFLFYGQTVSLPALTRVSFLIVKLYSETDSKAADIAIRCLTSIYGIWNLDFLRPINFGICFHTDTLQTLALDLIVGVYPLLLMVVSYVLIELYDRNFRPVVILWKPFRKLSVLFQEKWDLKTSLIDAFATTYILTNVKFQSVSFDLLAPVKVYHLNATGNWTYSIRLFYDATIPYFGSRHLPYGVIALLVLLLFAILPVLLLVLYPFRCFQKFLNLFPVRWYILHTFVDSFYGCYKDGTQIGTRDCRWFASLFILSRFCTMFIGACIQDAMYFHFSAIIFTIVALLFVSVQPFKENASHFTAINAFFALLLALLYTCVIGAMRGKQLLFGFLAIMFASLPLLYLSAIALHWMYRHWKILTYVIAKFRAWRNGYCRIQE